MGYLTLSIAPANVVCRALFVPDSEDALAIVRGAIQELTFARNWTKYGALTEQECADLFVPMFDALCFGKGPCRVIGEIIAYAGNTTPDPNWLICDGSAILQSAWPDLYAVIGTTYGSAPPGYFVLPDIRGRSLSGSGTGPGLSPVSLGQTYGEETHSLTESEGPTHSHTDTGHVHSEGNAVPTAITIGPGAPAPSALPSVGVTGVGSASLTPSGSGQGHNTIGPRLGILYLIVGRDG